MQIVRGDTGRAEICDSHTIENHFVNKQLIAETFKARKQVDVNK